MRIDKKLFIPFIVGLTSFWFWRLWSNNILLAILLLVLSLLIFSNYFKSNGIKKTIIVILFLFVSAFGLKNSYDRGLFRLNGLEKDMVTKRHEYYASTFGRIYKNRMGIYLNDKISVPVYKIQKNLFANFDLNLYFFKSHPRERGGASEFDKFHFVLLPLFVLGLFKFLRKGIFGIIYFILISLMSVFVYSGNLIGPFLFFPLIVSTISIGIITLFNKNEN